MKRRIIFYSLISLGILACIGPAIAGHHQRIVSVGVSLASDEAPVQVTVTRTVRVAGSCDVPQAASCNTAQACDTAQYQAECDVPRSFLFRLFYGDCAGAAGADADDDEGADFDDDEDD